MGQLGAYRKFSKVLDLNNILPLVECGGITMFIGHLGHNSILIYCLVAFVVGLVLIVIASKIRLLDFLITWFIRLGIIAGLCLVGLFYWSYELNALFGIISELVREFGTRMNFVIGSGIVGAFVGRSFTQRRSGDAA